MHERHLRGVADAMKHAFAEEGPAETDAIKTADQIVVLPDLDAVGVAYSMQPDIEIADPLIDPGIVAARLRRGAAGDDGLKARLTVTVKASVRTVRARREAIRNASSGITPRISGSTQ